MSTAAHLSQHIDQRAAMSTTAHRIPPQHLDRRAAMSAIAPQPTAPRRTTSIGEPR
ncbi:hypothetical protein AB0L41_32940 [Amycolatopsis mediterranei]|uniref:hypothetical protein n=1 Tax=Amycolatopsis mediterranei TaxID=33910 RepID=UPI00342000E7